MGTHTVAVTVILKVDDAAPLFVAGTGFADDVVLKIGKTSRAAKIAAVELRGVK